MCGRAASLEGRIGIEHLMGRVRVKDRVSVGVRVRVSVGVRVRGVVRAATGPIGFEKHRS